VAHPVPKAHLAAYRESTFAVTEMAMRDPVNLISATRVVAPL
jgi:hypothetical protein